MQEAIWASKQDWWEYEEVKRHRRSGSLHYRRDGGSNASRGGHTAMNIPEPCRTRLTKGGGRGINFLFNKSQKGRGKNTRSGSTIYMIDPAAYPNTTTK